MVPGFSICRSEFEWHSLARGLLACRLFALLIMAFLNLRSASASENPSAVALLRGVEAVRSKHSSLRATMDIHYIAPPPETLVQCVIEMDGSKIRAEVLPGTVPSQVIIQDGGEFTEYRRVKNGEVEIYDRDEAIGTRGSLVFDPRVIGLSPWSIATTSFENCLWYKEHEAPEVIGREELRGFAVWRVKAYREGGFAEYWIEEPRFRVHRQVSTMTAYIATTGVREEVVESFYDVSPADSPFPSRVVAEETGGRQKRTWQIKTLELGAEIPSERFSVSSMQLPAGTAFTDYRISRGIGYWNGEALQETYPYPAAATVAVAAAPVPPALPRPPVPVQKTSGLQVWFILINVGVIAGLVGYILWQRSASKGSGRS